MLFYDGYTAVTSTAFSVTFYGVLLCRTSTRGLNYLESRVIAISPSTGMVYLEYFGCQHPAIHTVYRI